MAENNVNQLLFSVVMPVFNRSDRSLPSVNSVLSQDVDSFELIIVDDGSTDGTIDVLRQWSEDPRVYIHSQPNKGVSAARNFGASMARGEYLIFLDSDDLLSAGYLSGCRRAIAGKPVRLFMASVRYLGPDGKVRRVRDPGRPDQISHGMAGSFAIERKFFNELTGYDANLTYSENSDLFLRIQHAGLGHEQVVVSPEVHVIIPFEDPVRRNLRHAPARHDNAVYFIRKHQSYFSRHPGHLFNFRRIEGHSAMEIGRYKEAERAFRQAMQLRPFKFKTWFSWLRSVALLLTSNLGRP